MRVKFFFILIFVSCSVQAQDFTQSLEKRIELNISQSRKMVKESQAKAAKLEKGIKIKKPGEVSSFINADDILKVQERAGEMAKTMKIQKVETKGMNVKGLRNLNKRVDREIERQKQNFLGSKWSKLNPFLSQKDVAELKDKKISIKAIGSGESIFILVSASVPKATIKNYLKSIHYLHSRQVTLAIQGLVGGDIQKTLIWSSALILKNPKCRGTQCEQWASIAINPLPFKDFKIDRVPAIVWTKKTPLGNGLDDQDYLTIQGDVSLDYALKKFAQLKPRSLAQQLLSKSK